MKSIATSFALLILLTLGCGTDPDIEEFCEGAVQGEINIRVMNISAFEVQNLNYQDVRTFSSILPGETTEYMQLESARDNPSRLDLTIEGMEMRKILTDILGSTELDEGCYTYLLYAVEYDEGNIFIGGRVYDNANLPDLNPISQDCPSIELTDCNTVSDRANIRVKNASAFDMCNIAIDMTVSESVIYGDLASGETSCYLAFSSVRAYPFQATLTLGGEDYLIENPTFHERLDDLENGLYTYSIYTVKPQDKLGDIQLSLD